MSTTCDKMFCGRPATDRIAGRVYCGRCADDLARSINTRVGRVILRPAPIGA